MVLPKELSVCEVTLRDGLQSEKTLLSTARKAALLRALRAAGCDRLEIGSFVGKAVPQMADTDALAALLPADGAEYRALILNQRGLERAIACGVKKAKLTVSVSETHQQKNANHTRAETFGRFEEMAARAAEAGVTLTGALSCAFGCPFEGEIDPAAVLDTAAEFYRLGVRELSLSDTIGSADPVHVFRLCEAARERFPDVCWTLHLHDTHGAGLANVLAGLEAGVARFDAALLGLGGCPFAPGAPGNLNVESLVYLCDKMGVMTGLSSEGLAAAADMLRGFLTQPEPGVPGEAESKGEKQ